MRADRLRAGKGQRTKYWGLRWMSGALLLTLCKAVGLELQGHRCFRPVRAYKELHLNRRFRCKHKFKVDARKCHRWMPGSAIDARDNTILRRKGQASWRSCHLRRLLKNGGGPEVSLKKIGVLRNVSVSKCSKTKGLHGQMIWVSTMCGIFL